MKSIAIKKILLSVLTTKIWRIKSKNTVEKCHWYIVIPGQYKKYIKMDGIKLFIYGWEVQSNGWDLTLSKWSQEEVINGVGKEGKTSYICFYFFVKYWVILCLQSSHIYPRRLTLKPLTTHGHLRRCFL